jgi:hypothetical protein
MSDTECRGEGVGAERLVGRLESGGERGGGDRCTEVGLKGDVVNETLLPQPHQFRTLHLDPSLPDLRVEQRSCHLEHDFSVERVELVGRAGGGRRGLLSRVGLIDDEDQMEEGQRGRAGRLGR